MDLKIEVWSPADHKSGGPTALSDLTSLLIAFGLDAKLVDPRQHNFSTANMGEESATATRRVVIAPEVWATDLLDLPTTVQKVLWWLSVDKAYPLTTRQKDRLYDRIGPATKPIMLLLGFGLRNRLRRHSDVVHIVQSEYARRHVALLTRHEPLMVTDRIQNVDRLVRQNESERPQEDRPTVVAYNPAKGGYAADRLRRVAGPGWSFVALQRMSAEQIACTLQDADFYIDFGEHPGRDRIPREAALADCIVVVGKRGSARNEVDLPIGRDYKVPYPHTHRSARRIMRYLTELAADRHEHSRNQENYRRTILAQSPALINEVRSLIAELEYRAAR